MKSKRSFILVWISPVLELSGKMLQMISIRPKKNKYICMPFFLIQKSWNSTLITNHGKTSNIQMYMITIYFWDSFVYKNLLSILLVMKLHMWDESATIFLLINVPSNSIQHYVIKFVSDLRQVGGFPRVLQFSTPIKLIATI